MSQTRVARHLGLLNEAFEQHINTPNGEPSGIHYAFRMHEEDPNRLVSELRYSQDLGRSQSQAYVPVASLDVGEERFQAFVSGTVSAIAENLPRFWSDLVQPDFALLTDETLVTREDFHRVVAEQQRESERSSAVSLLTDLAGNLGVAIPQSHPPYLILLRAVLLSDMYRKDFEELLDTLLDQWRALPAEERPATTEWLLVALASGPVCAGNAIWRGQERTRSDILTSEMDALHREWHGGSAQVPDTTRAPAEEDTPSEDAEDSDPRLEWTSTANCVVKVSFSQPGTWTRRFKNVGGRGAGVSLMLKGDFLETRLLDIGMTLDGTEHRLLIHPHTGGQARCLMPLAPQGEHEVQLTFHARGAGGGIIQAGVLAWTCSEDSDDGTGSVSSEQWDLLQLIVG
ncbi:hypothetical protein [Myxococcus stipitatus]|uniref:hypothetical protein n=1 Tax=Myxococcus stipitatus TaxID=83455 RepID=UPI0030D0CF37